MTESPPDESSDDQSRHAPRPFPWGIISYFCGYGVISVTFALCLFIGSLASNHRQLSASQRITIALFYIWPVLVVVGLITGIVGLLQRTKSRTHAIIGICLSISPALILLLYRIYTLIYKQS